MELGDVNAEVGNECSGSFRVPSPYCKLVITLLVMCSVVCISHGFRRKEWKSCDMCERREGLHLTLSCHLAKHEMANLSHSVATRNILSWKLILCFSFLFPCSPVIMIVMAFKQWLCVSHLVNGSMTGSCEASQTAEPLVAENKAHKKKEPTSQDVLMALGKLGVIMGYFFICDRYNVL